MLISEFKKLKLLKKAIESHEEEIYDALQRDFGKPKFETYVSEIGMVLEEIGLMIKELPKWADSEKVDTPITIHPGSSHIYRVPYGVTLVIGAWNYPFNLTLTPVVGAIAAGNCVIMKPSELSPNTSAIIAKIIGEIYEEEFVAVVEGAVKETQDLLAEEIRFYFLHRKYTSREDCSRSSCQTSHSNHFRTWRKKPLYCGKRCRLGNDCQANCLGEILERRADLHCARLLVGSRKSEGRFDFQDEEICERILWRQSARKPRFPKNHQQRPF